MVEFVVQLRKGYKKMPSVKKCDCYPAHEKLSVHGGKK